MSESRSPVSDAQAAQPGQSEAINGRWGYLAAPFRFVFDTAKTRLASPETALVVLGLVQLVGGPVAIHLYTYHVAASSEKETQSLLVTAAIFLFTLLLTLACIARIRHRDQKIPASSTTMFDRARIFLAYSMLLCGLCLIAAFAGYAKAGALDAILNRPAASQTETFLGFFTMSVPEDPAGSSQMSREVAEANRILLLCLTAIFGSLFFNYRAISRYRDDETVVFSAGEFWAGLTFRVGEAILFTLLLWLVISTQLVDWDYSESAMIVFAFVIGINVKTAEKLFGGIAERLLRGAVAAFGNGDEPAPPSTDAAPTNKDNSPTDTALPADEFDPTTTQYRAGNAYTLALLSEAAYFDLPTVTATVQQKLAMDAAEPITDPDNTGTQGYIASDASKIIVMLRGTERPDLRQVAADSNEANKIRDWLTNANANAVPFDPATGQLDSNRSLSDQGEAAASGMPTVHAGFLRAASSVYPGILSRIKQLNADANGRTIWLTGHSLGAAIATLIAMRLNADGIGVAGVYTFGSPRVGNLPFAAAYDEVLKSQTYRHVNDKDVVCRIPLERLDIGGLIFRYQHVGQLRFIDGDGNITDDLGLLQVVLSATQSLVDDWKNVWSEPLRDHAMSEYLQRIKNLLRR